VAAQRLVRKICPDCRHEVGPSPAQSAWLKKVGAAKLTLQAGAGCDSCRGTGYKGRTVVAEVFSIDEQAEELIVAGALRGSLEAHFRNQGVPFLVDDALRLIGTGVTTLAE